MPKFSKKERAESAVAEGKPDPLMELDLARFPPLEKSMRGRALFFDKLPSAWEKELKERGYSPTVLSTLPRRDVQDEVAYLNGVLQGMSEMTIAYDSERLKAVELAMKSHGMLDKRSLNITANVNADGTLEELWAWGGSRHTLQGNSTMVDPEKVERRMLEVVPKSIVRSTRKK